MVVDIISGERSTFIKIAPVIEAIQKEQRKGTELRYRLIYIGPHYDKNAGDLFFQELNIPKPNINIEIASGTQAEETAIIMARYEKLLSAGKPDLLLVTGNTIPAMACTLAAKKLNVQVAHIGAGIRTHDLSISEEINGLVTDAVCDYYFTTTHTANENLRSKGVKEESIFFVGNTLIDTLTKHIATTDQPVIWEKLQLEPHKYLVAFLQKPENVGDINDLKSLLIAIIESSRGLPVLFPVHPRALKTLQAIGIRATNLFPTEFLKYTHFQFLVQFSRGIITDSTCIQDETTALQIPCISVCNYADHPETVIHGTNKLVGNDGNAIANALSTLFGGNWSKGNIPYMWDSKAAERIVEVLKNMA